ncbi:hypothetical protein AB0M43_37665 [Longispora sp. NPDC051575]|uniref:hypothetical protein n=1 Tax=Longispora sp. NPDC051575 TaxID=3154943 RepID=UPI00341A7BE0
MKPAKAHLALQTHLFVLMTELCGYRTDTARATLVGVDRTTIRRARDGKPVSAEFVCGAVLGLQRHIPRLAAFGLTVSIDALFVVRTPGAGVRRLPEPERRGEVADLLAEIAARPRRTRRAA